jgi:16S rRNA (guanine527-N7)-methyltransferase
VRRRRPSRSAGQLRRLGRDGLLSDLGPLTTAAIADLAEAGLVLTARQQATLGAFTSLLMRWNQRVNLTAAKSAAEFDDHVADCLHVALHVPAVGTMIDVGAGGGLPSLVVAIARPQLVVTALEPVHKKHAFLRTAGRELGLTTFDARAERVGAHAMTAGYDVATSRATFDLVEWLELGMLLVKPGGLVIAMEGQRRDDLPAGAVRHPYALAGKQRALILMAR